MEESLSCDLIPHNSNTGRVGVAHGKKFFFLIRNKNQPASQSRGKGEESEGVGASPGA